MVSELGIYVHVPFCLSRCRYCDFNSVARGSPPWPRLEQALVTELRARRGAFEQASAKTLYFGGGTPSLGPVCLVRRILQEARALFSLHPQAEVTLEVNPATVDEEKLDGFRVAGVNRLSIGMQSTHDRVLSWLGRRHDAADGAGCMRAARRVGFDNISLDLIYAVPGQGMSELEADLDALLALAPEHISTYALTVHEDTALGRQVLSGSVDMPGEAVEVEMMGRIRERLIAAGLEHYEVSNFARPGRRAIHNSSYWSGAPYLGVGAGAHSFARCRWERAWRWETRRDVAAYLEAAADLREGRPLEAWPDVEWVEDLTAAQLANERIICGMRTVDGVNLDVPPLNRYRRQMEAGVKRVVEAGWARFDGTFLLPTEDGMQNVDAMALQLSV